MPRSSRRPDGSADASKRALLVAINDYGSPQNDLPSCLKDADQFRSILQSHYGFQNFTELYDKDATVANVEAGLAWLFDDVAPDDRLVFYYSGHGYQQPRNGNLEECLVLGNLEFLFDDRLSELGQSVPPGTLSVILDSCFSGGMEKRVLLGEQVEVARTKLWVPPPDARRRKSLSAGPLTPRPFGCRPVTDRQAVKRLVLGARSKTGGPQEASQDEAGQLRLNGLLLSACGENETSSASTSATAGMSAFTYALSRTLPASGDIANARLHDAVRDRLAELGFQQTPSLKAPPRPPGLTDASFVTLIPPAMAAEAQPAKRLPATTGGQPISTANAKGDSAMPTNQAFDDQFWQTVERVAAQVATAAGNPATASHKGFAPAVRPAMPSDAHQAEPANAGTAQDAGPPATPATRGNGEAAPASSHAQSASRGNGQATDSDTDQDADAQGQQKWIGVALSLAANLAPLVINAIRKRHKDFEPDGADADEKLASAVADVVTPAIIDTIAKNPKDFAVDAASVSTAGDDAAGDAKFPWGAVARVVASVAPAIVSEIAKRKGLVTEPAVSSDDQGPGVVVGAVAPAVMTAMARRQKDIGSGSADGHADGDGDEKGIPWGAIARVAATVVPSLVTEITHRKIVGPGFLPPAPGAREPDNRRFFAL
jgi:hypothetical protein